MQASTVISLSMLSVSMVPANAGRLDTSRLIMHSAQHDSHTLSDRPAPRKGNYIYGDEGYEYEVRAAASCIAGFVAGANKCGVDEWICKVQSCGTFRKDEIFQCCCKDGMGRRRDGTCEHGPYTNKTVDGCVEGAQRTEKQTCECLTDHGREVVEIKGRIQCPWKCDVRSTTGQRDENGHCSKLNVEGIPEPFKSKLERYMQAGSSTLKLDGMPPFSHPEGLVHVAEILHTARHHALFSLYLTNSHLGGDEMKLIAEALVPNRRLQELFLEGNKIGHEGAVALAALMKKLPELEMVRLRSDDVDNEADKEMLRSAKPNAIVFVDLVDT